MLKKMAKAITKMLIPSAEKLSASAAGKIQEAFNGTAEEKRQIMAKWAATAEDLTAVVNRLAGMLNDGELDDEETAEIACLIEPVMIRVRESI